MTSWVGDRMGDVTILQYSDADLASDLRTRRSASAGHQVIWAPSARAIQSMASRRQTCVSHSTFEAEVVAAGLVAGSAAVGNSATARGQRRTHGI
eukprot:6333914-Pyramimonas_sp.AAC.1